jgi:hypothetical protein
LLNRNSIAAHWFRRPSLRMVYAPSKFLEGAFFLLTQKKTTNK